MELICTNSKHDSGMKFTSPEFFIPFRTQLVNRPVFPFATLETTRKKKQKQKQNKTKQNKKTGTEMRPAIVSGIATGDAPVSKWPIFFPAPGNSPRSLHES